MFKKGGMVLHAQAAVRGIAPGARTPTPFTRKGGTMHTTRTKLLVGSVAGLLALGLTACPQDEAGQDPGIDDGLEDPGFEDDLDAS